MYLTFSIFLFFICVVFIIFYTKQQKTISILQNDLAIKLEKINLLESENVKINNSKSELEELYSSLNCKFHALQAEKDTVANNFKIMNETLLYQFKDIANNVMKNHGEQFKNESAIKINAILEPIQAKLGIFQDKMQECFNFEIREKLAIKESIRNVIESNEKIKTEAHKLHNALLGNKLSLGNWGEVVLENILNYSGLRKNYDYFIQTQLETSKLRPDVIIKLPDEKCIVIDSKISSFDIEIYENSEEKKEQTVKHFAQKIKNHIDVLSSKEYFAGLNTPEVTLMFIPVESWYNIVIKHYPELYSFAWSKNVAITSPSTLFVMLKTVAYIWKQKIQAQNSAEIAKNAGALYDGFVDFIETLLDIGKSLEKAEASYEKALNKLKSGRGNLITRSEKMKQLGISNTKIIPIKIIQEETESAQ